MKKYITYSMITILMFILALIQPAFAARSIEVTLIDFEDRDYSFELEGVGLIYSSGGYTFTDEIGPEEPYPQNTYFHYVGPEYRYYAGSVALAAVSGYSTITLTRDDGKPFSIVAIDLAELNGPGVGPNVTFEGVKISGEKVTQTFILNGKSGAQHFIFPNSFSDLAYVKWQQTDPLHFFDNVILLSSPIREPDHNILAWYVWFLYGLRPGGR